MPGDGATTGANRDRSHGHLSPEASHLAAHLRERVAREGSCYLKSREIAREIDLSAKQIGAYMAQLRDREAGISVEPWAYTNGTTWYVSR